MFQFLTGKVLKDRTQTNKGSLEPSMIFKILRPNSFRTSGQGRWQVAVPEAELPATRLPCLSSEASFKTGNRPGDVCCH